MRYAVYPVLMLMAWPVWAALRFPGQGFTETGAVFYHDGREAARVDGITLGEGVTLRVLGAGGAAARLAPAVETRFRMLHYIVPALGSTVVNGPVSEAFERLDFEQVTPGVSAALVAGSRATMLRVAFNHGDDLMGIRFKVEAGGQPAALRLVTAGTGAGLYWTANGREGRIFYPDVFALSPQGRVFGGLITYQIEEGGVFRLNLRLGLGVMPDWPLVAELALGTRDSRGGTTEPVTDGRGQIWLARDQTVARFDARETLLSLTVLDGLTVRRTVAGPNGELAVLGDALQGPAMGALDADGRLAGVIRTPGMYPVSAEFAADGTVHYRGFQGLDNGAARWVPGKEVPEFLIFGDYTAFGAGLNGETVAAFPGRAAEGFAIVVEWWDRLGITFQRRRLTIAEPERLIAAQANAIAVDPVSGDVWVAASFLDGRDARGNVLVKLSRDGSRELYRGSSPVLTERLVSDGAGGVSQFGRTEQLSHPTPADALYRGACEPVASYYQRIDGQGRLLDGTYLSGVSAVLSPWAGLELFGTAVDPVSGDTVLRRRDARASRNPPAVSCIVDAASRLAQVGSGRPAIAPGQLVTLIGQGIGHAAGGSRVTVGDVPATVVAEQPGLVTVLVPDAFLTQRVLALAVDGSLAGGAAVETQTELLETAAFGFVTADGHGWGPAAALNQDGSINSPERPALAGTVVSLFGTGFERAQEVVLLVDDQYVVRPEFVGAAPGLTAGVTQVNFRMSAQVRSGRVVVSVAKLLPSSLGYWPKPRITLEVSGGAGSNDSH